MRILRFISFARACGARFLSGSLPTGQGDLRAHLPRFRADNLEQNRHVLEVLKSLSAEKGVTITQLAIAWALAKSNSIVPVIGARTRAQLQESLEAIEMQLSPEDLARIEQAVPPVAGTRYDANQMRMLDSER